MRTKLQPGEILDGRFQITALIREGATASVFEAKYSSTGETVAIKVPFPHLELNPVYSARFEQEEKIAAELHHPSILRVIRIEKKTRPYIVMERLEGKLLSQLLREKRVLPVEEALGIALRIARGVEYLHGEKVIHRDLKPSNVVLCSDGSIRIIDFGLAIRRARGLHSRPLGFSPSLGTPDYMPPEHVKGEEGDERSDIYSLGVILYEMTTGRMPFQSDDLFVLMHARLVGDPVAPRKLNEKISPPLQEIILRALERRPEARYGSITELANDLEAPDRVTPTGRELRLRAPASWAILWMRSRRFVWTMLIFTGIMALFMVLAMKAPGFKALHHR